MSDNAFDFSALFPGLEYNVGTCKFGLPSEKDIRAAGDALIKAAEEQGVKPSWRASILFAHNSCAEHVAKAVSCLKSARFWLEHDPEAREANHPSTATDLRDAEQAMQRAFNAIQGCKAVMTHGPVR